MKTKLLLTFLALAFLNRSPIQEVFYQIKSESHIIHPETNSFSTKVFEKGICPSKHKEVFNIYYSEMEEIKNLSVRYKNEKGKWKRLSKNDIVSSSVPTQSFYAGIRKYSFVLKAEKKSIPFEVSYQKITKDLMFLARLSFQDNDNVDTFSYKIEVPTGHELKYEVDKTTKSDSTIYITKDQLSGQSVYHFLSTSSSRTYNIDEDSPGIRLFVHPSSVDPFDYFNDWYNTLVKPHSKLNQNTIADMKMAVEGIEDKQERIKTIFQLVQKRISYIAFESGIGAVQPRDVNEVFNYKQGDCKDMGNLLCQTLKHFGYDAHMAISATLSHRYDLDFPCLASANHAICVVNMDGQWVYLDATESHGLFGFPSRHIQDRNIFIINENEGLLHKVKKVSPTANQANYNYAFKKIDNGLTGKMSTTFKGLSQMDFAYINNFSTPEKAKKVLHDYISSWSKNISVDSLDLSIQAKEAILNSHVTSSKNFTKIKARTYLSLNFLPQPELAESNIKPNERIIYYETKDDHYEVIVDLQTAINLKEFTPIIFNEAGMRFKFEVTQEGPNSIKVKYNYYNEHLLIKTELIDPYNQINQLIKTTFQKSIIYDVND